MLVNNRKDATQLAQLRAGFSQYLNGYLQRIDEAVNPNCPMYYSHPHILEQWMDDQFTLPFVKCQAGNRLS